jgi:hypothetical protein
MGDERFVRETRAAELLGVSVHKLRRDRCQNKGLSYIRLGGAIIYDLDAVEIDLEAMKVRPEEKKAM